MKTNRSNRQLLKSSSLSPSWALTTTALRRRRNTLFSSILGSIKHFTRLKLSSTRFSRRSRAPFFSRSGEFCLLSIMSLARSVHCPNEYSQLSNVQSNFSFGVNLSSFCMLVNMRWKEYFT